MRRRKLLIVILLFAAVAGAVVIGLRSGHGFIKIVRDQGYGADRRIVTFRLTGWSSTSYPNHSRFQARLGSRWTEPAEAFGGGKEVACILPVQADKCRLLLRVQRPWLSERAFALLEKWGLMQRLPGFRMWVILHLPTQHPPVKDVTIETDLPRMEHNRVGGRITLPPPTPPSKRVRTRRFRLD
jgi:hypothetical protein